MPAGSAFVKTQRYDEIGRRVPEHSIQGVFTPADIARLSATDRVINERGTSCGIRPSDALSDERVIELNVFTFLLE